MSDPTYRLLRELAGRVDDDLLATGRELVAVGEEGHALELLVAELVAGRAVLPYAVRSELVAEAAARAQDRGYDVLHVPDHLGAPAPFPTLAVAATASTTSAAMKPSRSPSSTPCVSEVSNPVRRSFTIW